MIHTGKITTILLLLMAGFLFHGCDSIFGSKDNNTTDEIFDEGRIDPTLETTDGYAALTPFWTDFDAPTDVFVGFDGFVYVTDAVGVHALDRADLAPRRTIELPGAVSVTQDRLLNLYVVARINLTKEENELIGNLPDGRSEETWNLPAVYKIKNLNGAGEIAFQDTIIHPFSDQERSVGSIELRLDKNSAINDELVEFTGVGVLEDNKIYVSRRGPRNAPLFQPVDNTILEFRPRFDGGVNTSKMEYSRRIGDGRTGSGASLNPLNPTLTSAIEINEITTFINPPQRDNFPGNTNILLAQGAVGQNIPFRVLQLNLEDTPDGLLITPNQQFLVRDTSNADGFLYEENKFDNPAGLAVAGDQTGYIFVVDSEQHKLYQFKPNGEEGVDPPPAAVDRSRNLTVSFGEFGTGPRQFNTPSGVAYFGRIVYVADTGNNRIARYRLTTDFE